MTVATEDPVRLMWSPISACQQCPAKWWSGSRVPSERTPSALHIGKAVYRALDVYYASRMEGYCPGPARSSPRRSPRASWARAPPTAKLSAKWFSLAFALA